MIEIISGSPGSGKTNWVVTRLLGAEHKDRSVFVCGIRDFDHGALKTEELEYDAVANWQNLPDGSLVIVDEAWRVMPSSGKQAAPQWLKDLAEHRHRGFDFWLICQEPRQLHVTVRRLCGKCVYLVRRSGSLVSTVFEYDSAEFDMVKDRRRAQKSLHKISSKAYRHYTSSTVDDRIRFKMPGRVWWFLILIVGGFGTAMYLGSGFFTDEGFTLLADKDVFNPDSAGSTDSVSSSQARPGDPTIDYVPVDNSSGGPKVGLEAIPRDHFLRDRDAFYLGVMVKNGRPNHYFLVESYLYSARDLEQFGYTVVYYAGCGIMLEYLLLYKFYLSCDPALNFDYGRSLDDEEDDDDDRRPRASIEYSRG